MSTDDRGKAERRRAARAEALALKQKQAARDRRNRIVTFSLLGAAVVALLVVFVVVLMQGEQSSDRFDFADQPLADVADVPSTARPDGGIPVGTDGAAGTTTQGAPELGIYYDYMCPICGQFEKSNGAAVDTMISDGDATVVFYPVAILDPSSSGTYYSTRAASAAAWVADRAPEAFLDYHDALYVDQPLEQTKGLTDERLAEIATQAGVPQDVATGISDGTAVDTFGQWVTSATQAASGNSALANPQGGFGTPTLTLDGQRWDGNWQDPDALPAAVAQAGRR
jgi:protein-disulfide isomerase